MHVFSSLKDALTSITAIENTLRPSGMCKKVEPFSDIRLATTRDPTNKNVLCVWRLQGRAVLYIC